MMEYADHHGFPIVTFIDTPGAYADIRSEEEGQVCVLLMRQEKGLSFNVWSNCFT